MADRPERAPGLARTGPLDAGEAERLLAHEPVRLVIWLGDVGSGKTALTTQLYEHQRHVRNGVDFAGSWTLLALERLAHHHRNAQPVPSQGGAGDGDPRAVLHLALTADAERVDLLFADLPGELFGQLADNRIQPEAIPWLRRAEKLVLLADGDRLRDRAARSTVVTRARQLLECLRFAGLPRAENSLALATTKWDLVAPDPAALAYWKPRELELLAEMRALDARAQMFRVSALAGREDADALRPLREWLLGATPAASGPPLGRYEWPLDAPTPLRLPSRRRAGVAG